MLGRTLAGQQKKPVLEYNDSQDPLWCGAPAQPALSQDLRKEMAAPVASHPYQSWNAAFKSSSGKKNKSKNKNKLGVVGPGCLLDSEIGRGRKLYLVVRCRKVPDPLDSKSASLLGQGNTKIYLMPSSQRPPETSR